MTGLPHLEGITLKLHYKKHYDWPQFVSKYDGLQKKLDEITFNLKFHDEMNRNKMLHSDFIIDAKKQIKNAIKLRKEALQLYNKSYELMVMLSEPYKKEAFHEYEDTVNNLMTDALKNIPDGYENFTDNDKNIRKMIIKDNANKMIRLTTIGSYPHDVDFVLNGYTIYLNYLIKKLKGKDSRISFYKRHATEKMIDAAVTHGMKLNNSSASEIQTIFDTLFINADVKPPNSEVLRIAKKMSTIK